MESVLGIGKIWAVANPSVEKNGTILRLRQ